MASPEAIGIKRENAMARIEAAVSQLVEAYSLEKPDLEPFDRDPNLKHAMQLENLAGFLDALVFAINNVPAISEEQGGQQPTNPDQNPDPAKTDDGSKGAKK